MNGTVRNILYSPLWLFLHGAAFLPLPVLYVISDVLAFLTYSVVRYRRKLVKENIYVSFPEKSDEEKNRIIRRFYRNFTDVFVETVKLLHVSDKEMRRRIVFEGCEQVDAYTREGKSVALYAAHFCNWEWLSAITMWVDNDEKIHYSQVYRPLRNQWFDHFYFELRKRFNSESIPKNGVLRQLLQYRRDGGRFVTGFISDQKPSHNDGLHHICFLNQDTPFISGTELLVKKMKAAVMYFDIHRVSRGYYKVTMRKIADDASQCGEFELTDRFAQILEEAIRKEPDAWLWSHNRWRR